MRILVTNDDGIYSPGIATLAKVALRFGEVQIVAPDVEQSSMGHAITASRPLYYKNHPLLLRGWTLTGSMVPQPIA
ncbi:5'/3'-nucleotidase SurE [Paraflavitalea speifideaquila]|uniref:5'/3'-nucleotidase SurE n=1 Tax=Paraflavitalea speifideaquila TaxID=3076558 RepID=UPI0028EB1A80|nr:5'/3'-nucleotidase SurE [Paraflavitalea speifideiaquila]